MFNYTNASALLSSGLGKRKAQHKHAPCMPHAGDPMLGRTLIGSLLITLLTSLSIAAEGEHLVVRNKQQCYKALASVESQLNKRVKDKTLDEKQIDELNLILDE